MITKLIAFFQSLEPNAFYAQDAENEPFYDIEEGLAGIDWQQPGSGMQRSVLVLWNADSTQATVTGIDDDYRLIVKAKTAIFAQPAPWTEQIITLSDFVATLHQPETWFIRRVDALGIYFHSVAENLNASDQDEEYWRKPVRVLWNDAKNVVLVGKAIDANEDPDRRPLVIVHESIARQSTLPGDDGEPY